MRSNKPYNIHKAEILHLLCLTALIAVSLSCSNTTSADEDQFEKMVDEVRAMTGSYTSVESAATAG